MHPFLAVSLVFAIFFFFLGGFHPGSLPFPPLSVVFWSPRVPLWLKLACHFFGVFFGPVFWWFVMRFWLIFLMIFRCFSHTSSNRVFAYFFLGRFSNVCTLSKHGIFKKPCFSQVKTLFRRNRLCRQPMRKCISWDGIVPCFLLNVHDFWCVFDSCLRWFLHVFHILVRAVFLLTFSSDVFRMYAHFQNTGSSKNSVF